MHWTKPVTLSLLFAPILTLLLLADTTTAQQQNQPQQQQQQQPPQASGDDVVSVVSESPDHTIFAQMIEEAQLTETLQQAGPFTILAPTDEALEELGSELDEVRSEPQRVQNVVINHLFQGEASAEEVEETFEVEVNEGDIEASNGVIHSLNEVLLER